MKKNRIVWPCLCVSVCVTHSLSHSPFPVRESDFTFNPISKPLLLLIINLLSFPLFLCLVENKYPTPIFFFSCTRNQEEIGLWNKIALHYGYWLLISLHDFENGLIKSLIIFYLNFLTPWKRKSFTETFELWWLCCVAYSNLNGK